MKSIKFIYGSIFLFVFSLTSCNKALEADIPKGKFVSDAVFQNDNLAEAAMRGVYSSMTYNTLGTPFLAGFTATFSLWSDEYEKLTYSPDQKLTFENNLAPNNAVVSSFWNPLYSYVYQANMVNDNVVASTKLSNHIKQKLTAESRFIRALALFYLANIYGDVPLVLSSDYSKNAKLGVSNNQEVINQVIDDLKYAKANLSDVSNTTVGNRFRANRWVATALLSRVYLYQKNWQAAEREATEIIDQTSLYTLESLENVFLTSSKEAIWALQHTSTQFTTNDAVSIQGMPNSNSFFIFSPYTLQQFDPTDQRKIKWTKTIGNTTAQYKFKTYSNLAGNKSEAPMVFRLAEQYLIRAEARAMQAGKIEGAIADVDAIRIRAGAVGNNLGNNADISFKTIAYSRPGIAQDELIKVIFQERIRELFGEFGHRWFDAKRTEEDLNEFFEGRKPNMRAAKAYFPIPQLEIERNGNLKQREDY